VAVRATFATRTLLAGARQTLFDCRVKTGGRAKHSSCAHECFIRCADRSCAQERRVVEVKPCYRGTAPIYLMPADGHTDPVPNTHTRVPDMVFSRLRLASAWPETA